MRYRTLGSLALACLALAAAESAHAIDVHLDNPFLSIQQAASGNAWADFTGTLDITPGFQYMGGSYEIPYTAGGQHLNKPSATSNRLPGVLFSFLIAADDLPGLYAFDANGNSLEGNFAECPIEGGICNNVGFSYSLEVLAAADEPNAVPEPSALGLVGAALAGLALTRKRKARPSP